jgi:hypothetical protein
MLEYATGISKASSSSDYPQARDFVIDGVSGKFMYARADSKTE